MRASKFTPMQELERIIREDRKEIKSQISKQTKFIWLTVIAFTIDLLQLGSTLINFDVRSKVESARIAAESTKNVVTETNSQTDRLEKMMNELKKQVDKNTAHIIQQAKK